MMPNGMVHAFEHEADYNGCRWLDASEAAIDASTARLAATQGVPARPEDTSKTICRAIRTRLDAERHLLILDNLERAVCLPHYRPKDGA